MIPDLKACHAFANFDHHAGTFMAENGREDSLRVIARTGKLVSMAKASGLDFHQNFTCAWTFEVHLHDLKRLARGHGHGGTCFHHRKTSLLLNFFCLNQKTGSVICQA